VMVRVDSRTWEVQIDYQEAGGFSNVLVNASGGLMPLIRCSNPDINGKDYGFGNFTRSYDQSAGMVTFTAPTTYGIYAFDKWLKTTNSVTETVPYESVMVNALYHNWITAVYKLNVPQLDLPDTVYAEWDQGSMEITVKNSYVVDHTPMEWFSETDESWVSFDAGTQKGVEEGTIRLVIANNTGAERTGEFTVYALDAVNPEKVITIIQKENAAGIRAINELGGVIKVYPNPVSSQLMLELPVDIGSGIGIITLHSLDGKTVRQHHLPLGSTGSYTLHVDDLSPGMYLIKLIQEEKSWLNKFSKE
jgi:hypothetical protein